MAATLKDIVEQAEAETGDRLVAFVNGWRDESSATPEPDNPCFHLAQRYFRFAKELRERGNPLSALHYERIGKCLRYASALAPKVSHTAGDFLGTHFRNCAEGLAVTLVNAGLTQEKIHQVIDLSKDHLYSAAMLGRSLATLERQGRLDNLDDTDI